MARENGDEKVQIKTLIDRTKIHVRMDTANHLLQFQRILVAVVDKLKESQRSTLKLGSPNVGRICFV